MTYGYVYLQNRMITVGGTRSDKVDRTTTTVFIDS